MRWYIPRRLRSKKKVGIKMRNYKKEKILSLSPEGRYCFFGYYDKCPWDEREEYFLFHEVEFQDHPPSESDKARICLMELQTGKIDILDETYAWNFQQGAMLQWLSGRKIIYNTRIKKEFAAKIFDIDSGKTRILNLPVSAISPDGRYALSLNFARLAKWRPGYGYEGGNDPFENKKWPEKDGIWLIDLESGKYKLIISLAQILGFRKEENIKTSFAWFNHTLFNKDGKRFCFVNRWKEQTGQPHKTRFITGDLEGKEVYDLIDSYLISHFDWKNEREIIVWAEIKGERGFWLVEDKTGKFKIVSKKIQKTDGHCSYSTDEKTILFDTYPIENYRYLKIFPEKIQEEVVLGKFYSSPHLSEKIRCDLHPRWSRSQKFISFDSTHEGYRKVYVINTPDL